MSLRTDEEYMKEAIELAKKAASYDETPIGAIIVFSGVLNNSKEKEECGGINKSKNKRIRQTQKKSYISHIENIEKKIKIGTVIGRGINKRNLKMSALAHAEIEAINEANKVLGDWRLEGCTLYVTLEPCQMCAGALLQSRIDRIVFGAASIKSGACGSIIDMTNIDEFNHQILVTKGVLEKECTELLTNFFKGVRNNV